MCAMEHEEVRQESFWSRVPVFRSTAEFKLHRLRTPETAKKVLQEALRSRFGVALPIGSLGDMHRLAKSPPAFWGQSTPRGRVLSKKGRVAGGAEFRTPFKTVLQRTVRGRPVCSVDRMNYASPVDFRRAEGGRKSFGSRLPNFGFEPEFKLRPLPTYVAAPTALRKTFGSRPACSVAREMPSGGVARRSEGGRKVIGRRLANSASEAEFNVLPLIAAFAGPEGTAKVVRRWPLCTLARHVNPIRINPDIREEVSHER